MSRRRSALHPRVTHRHDVDDPRVPVTGCFCDSCEASREDDHWAVVGNLLGLVDYGTCKCGRSLDDHGRCLAGAQCQFFEQAVRR